MDVVSGIYSQHNFFSNLLNRRSSLQDVHVWSPNRMSHDLQTCMNAVDFAWCFLMFFPAQKFVPKRLEHLCTTPPISAAFCGTLPVFGLLKLTPAPLARCCWRSARACESQSRARRFSLCRLVCKPSRISIGVE